MVAVGCEMEYNCDIGNANLRKLVLSIVLRHFIVKYKNNKFLECIEIARYSCIIGDKVKQNLIFSKDLHFSLEQTKHDSVMDASSRVDAGRNRLTGHLLAFLFEKITKLNILM